MKVMLLQDVEKFGKEGTVINVADGHARNFLIPKKYAIEANKINLKIYENRKREWNLRHSKEIGEAQKFADDVAKLKCKITRKVGEQEKLYGSVTSMDIVDVLKKEKIDIDKKKILLEESIKSVGNYSIPIKVHPEVTAYLKIEVVKE
ncbi:50S ribosomal protein L9 [bacterium]|nr:50S ribosomal protein L9 [bacterium]